MDIRENALQRLAQRLTQLREERNLSIEELAARAGLTPDLVRKIEAAETDPTISAILSLASGLGITGVGLVSSI